MKQALITGDFFLIIGINLIRLLVEENTSNGVKLDYIHWNPVRAGICTLPEEYKYSSALFYETGNDNPSASSGRISFSSSGLT